MHAPDFWSSPSAAARAAAWALSPFSAVYSAAGACRLALSTPYRAPVPVVCVGNLTVGGTGKTPAAIAIGKRLLARGKRVFFLTRGYRSTLKQPALALTGLHTAAEAGDEPLLLAAHAPTVLSADRAAGARLAAEQGAEVIVMDDGFQNPGLHKDLSFVVVDAATQFGNGFVLPAGPLREPVRRGLARAQAVILMGEGSAPVTGLPVLRARIEPSAEAIAFVRGRKVSAFAGIGRPAKFFDALKAAGAQVVLARSFPDHYAFRDADWAALAGDAAEYAATLVTTEKDWVRLKPAWRDKARAFPVHAEFSDWVQLDRILERHV
jgi:tetraacyldisaccharide 4'-kinase